MIWLGVAVAWLGDYRQGLSLVFILICYHSKLILNSETSFSSPSSAFVLFAGLCFQIASVHLNQNPVFVSGN